MYKRVTDSSTLPVSINEMMRSLYLTDDDVDSDELNDYIISAKHLWEEDTNVLLGSQSWTLKLDNWPWGDELYIEKQPITSVDSIQYYNEAEVLTTLSADDYWVELDYHAAKIVIKDSWPDLVDLRPGKVIINFTAGYVDTPGDIKQAIKSLVGHYYANRQEEVFMPGMSSASISNGYKTVKERHKLYASNRNIRS